MKNFQGISKNRFYKETGLSNGFLDKNNHPIADKLEQVIYTYPELNVEWLLTGQGAMLKSDTYSYITKPMIENNFEKNIPLVDVQVVADFGSGQFSIKKSDVKEYYVVPKFKDRKIDFMIEVSGDSMYPKYASGDIVACAILYESQFIQWGKVYVIATRQQGILVKRINKSENENCLLAVSDNPSYPPFDLPKNEITGLTLVVGVIRLE